MDSLPTTGGESISSKPTLATARFGTWLSRKTGFRFSFHFSVKEKKYG
jgi:hypothetical protein